MPGSSLGPRKLSGLFMTAALIAAACGGAATTTAPAATTAPVGSAPAASAAPTAAGAQPTLTYWASNQGTSLDNDKQVLTPELDKFTQQTGIKVNLEVVPWSDLLNRILAATTSGQGPDVLNIGNTWSASLQATGAFTQFDDATMNQIGGKDRFLAGSLSATGAAGKPPTAVPLYSLAYGLYYNKAQFAAAGITQPPTTWGEFVADAKKLTTPQHWGLSLECGSISENVHSAFTLSQQQGGAFFDDSGKPTFNTPQNIAAIKQYIDFMQSDKIVNPSDAEYSNGTEALSDFAKGKSSMVIWQAASGSLAQLGMNAADIGVAALPLPDQMPAGGKKVTSMVTGINGTDRRRLRSEGRGKCGSASLRRQPSTRLADHELRREHHLSRQVVPRVDVVEQKTHHLVAHRFDRMPHAREWRSGRSGYRLVIESHDGDIVRNPTAGTLQHTESHRGHRVRGHE